MPKITQIPNMEPMITIRRTAERFGVPLTPNTNIALLLGGRHCADLDCDSRFRPVFARAKYDGAVLPYPVEPNRVLHDLKQIRECGQVKGILVTDPYKIDAYDILMEKRIANSMEETAMEIGSLNQIKITNNRHFIGWNNDGTGFVKGFRREAGVTFGNKSVMLLGSGVAGRAIAAALTKDYPKAVFAFDNNEVALTSLHRMLGKMWPDTKERLSLSARQDELASWTGRADVIINATGADLQDFPFSRIRPDTKVVDIGRSSFLASLKAASPRVFTLDGVPMSIMTNVDHLLQIFGLEATYEELKAAAADKRR